MFLLIAGSAYFALQMGGKRAALFAGALVFGSNLFWELGLTARVDATMALFALSAWLSLRELIEEKNHNAAPVFGLCAGMTMGLKATGLIYILPAVTVFLCYSLWLRVAQRQVLLALLLLAPGTFWYGRTMFHFGASVYPYQFSVGQGVKIIDPFVEKKTGEKVNVFSFADSFLPTKYSPENGVQVSNPKLQQIYREVTHVKRIRSSPPRLSNFWSLLFDQKRHARKPYHSYLVFIFAFILMPWEWWRKVTFSLALTSSFAYFVAISLKTPLLRHLAVTMPYFAIGSALVFEKLNQRVSSKSLSAGKVFLGGIVFYCNVFSVSRYWRQVEQVFSSYVH